MSRVSVQAKCEESVQSRRGSPVATWWRGRAKDRLHLRVATAGIVHLHMGLRFRGSKTETLQQFLISGRAKNFGSVTTGSAAVVGADSGAGEEAPDKAGTRGLPGGPARTRLQSASE